MQLDHQRQLFEDYLASQIKDREPRNLYDPISYILQLGGKRIRPSMVLLGAEVVGGKAEQALAAAMAVEVFHNFSLVHDDIMDEAPLRRGQPTVHKKWNINTAILSGDVMLVNAYQYLEVYQPSLQVALFRLFSRTAQEVCEGQQWDMDFPKQTHVELEDYLQMITNKTAVLLGCALAMGAMIGGANNTLTQQLYDFGKQLGISFQLLDDYLDTYGDPETFGKQVGGDIIENKKTWLFLYAQQHLPIADREVLEQWFKTTDKAHQEKIEAVKSLFEKVATAAALKKEIEQQGQKAFSILAAMEIDAAAKASLETFGTSLMGRTF
ncbi:MAG: polyprenyl synthetase family protein [Flavobacteriaceae bacterium]